MKFCAVVCELNPFHNGHKYLFDQIRKQSGCDKILCLMSGNFTQRGDAAVMGKFTRARHAVENGADVVLELPAAFSVAPAEIFAGGAVRILSSLPSVSVLAFGCESGTKEDFLAAARATLSEDKLFKAALKENMKDGTSYAKARTDAVLALNRDLSEELFTSPNNLLGVEYCRALLASGSAITPMPVLRVGGGYADAALYKEFSSATAIRKAAFDGDKKTKKTLKNNLPADVFDDLSRARETPFRQAAVCALLSRSPDEVTKCPDCSEGLENKLRAMAKSNPRYDDLLDKVVSKRYTASRLKRILAQNFLGLERKDVRAWLEAPLYCKVLAIRRKDQGDILSALSKGSFPLLARKSDAGALKKEALACFEADLRANDLYNVLTETSENHYEMLFV